MRAKIDTSRTWQFKAWAASTANSTARRLSTGKAPGRPRHTGHTLVLGGAPNFVEQPQRFVRGLAGHRRQREGQILRLLREDVGDIPTMVERMYVGLDSRLIGAAGRSVLAHLIDLENRGLAREDGERWRSAA